MICGVDETVTDATGVEPAAVEASQSLESLAELLSSSKPIDPPNCFLQWLSGDKKGLQPNTVKLYKYDLGQFLRFAKIYAPSKPTSLELVWDDQIVTAFFSTLKLMISPSTIPNYHCSQQAARRYLWLHGLGPEKYPQVQEGFNMLGRVTQKQKIRNLLKKTAAA